MKYILIIDDGCADNPVPALGGKTPLEYARIPHVDALAAKGVVGNTLNVPHGLPAGSDTAILSIFGCDPTWCYTGRAPLEVAAQGIALSPGDVAMRCNMVSYEDCDKPFEERKILSHSAGSISAEDSIAVISALIGEPEFAAAMEAAGITIYKSPSFRHFAVQKQADIRGIKLMPPHDHLGEVIGPLLPAGCANAAVLKDLMKLAFEKLDKHPLNAKRRAEGKMPANGIWFWAEGTAVKLPSFVENYGKTGGVISAVPLCKGIARLTGLEAVEVEGANGDVDTNYQGKVDAAVALLRKGDFAAIHLEAPDECTHNGDTQGKIKAIECMDSEVIVPLTAAMQANGWDYRLLLLSDHKTLTSTRGHDGDPVPFMLYDSRVDTGAGGTFCEKQGENGPTVDAGVKLMDLLFETGK